MEFIADTHVHLYPVYNLAAALRGAMVRLARLAPGAASVICLTERSDCHVFRDLASGAAKLPPPLSCYPAGANALCITDNENEKLYVIAGRQIATLEKLEVHSLGCDAPIPDKLPIADTIENVIAGGGIPVIPWGLGKWLGKRGALVREMAGRYPELLLSDSAMRPSIWPEPIFSAARSRVIAGSDPLPILGDDALIGTYATKFSAPFNANDPVASLRAALRDTNANNRTIVGHRCGLSAVIGRSLALRKAKA